MPNWCSNSLSFSGNKKQLSELHNLFLEMEQKYQENGYGQLPAICKEADGWFFDLYISDCGEYEYETRWTPNIDNVEIIAKHFKLDFVLIYSEPGCELYGEYSFADGTLEHIYLDGDDYAKFYYHDNSETYFFEGEEYSDSIDILEKLLSRKKLVQTY